MTQVNGLHLLIYRTSVLPTISWLHVVFALARVLKAITLNQPCLLLKTVQTWVNTWLAVPLSIAVTLVSAFRFQSDGPPLIFIILLSSLHRKHVCGGQFARPPIPFATYVYSSKSSHSQTACPNICISLTAAGVPAPLPILYLPTNSASDIASVPNATHGSKFWCCQCSQS